MSHLYGQATAPLPDVHSLAESFCIALQAEIGDHMDTVNARNFPDGKPREDGACASHDFCDANQMMLDAWDSLTVLEYNPADTRHQELLREAWAMAKAAEFNPYTIRRDFVAMEGEL